MGTIREVVYPERTLYPYSAVGVVFVTWADGTQSSGTASVVGKNDILTATHVVYNPDRGGWATEMSFYFGADYNAARGNFDSYVYSYSMQAGTYRWRATAWPTQAFADSDNDTMSEAEAQYDVALIGVSIPIGDTLGSFGMAWGRDYAQTLTQVGYPASSSGMMASSVNVTRDTFYAVYEAGENAMGPGSSGGPLFTSDDYIVGVKSSGGGSRSVWADVGFLSSYLIEFLNSNDSLLAGVSDSTPPTAVSFTPADGAPGTAIDSNVVVTFSEAIQRGTGSIVLKTAAGVTVETYNAATSTNLSISGSTLTINPTAHLAYGTSYKVEFAAGTIKDLAGNSYAGTASYDFTTGAAPDRTPPTVLAFSPADGATGVGIGSNVVVTFSEAIQRGTGNIVLKTAAGVTVEIYNAATSGNLSFSGSTLTVNPTANLAYGTGYKVEFAAGSIKDLAGNSYAGTAGYDFTTARSSSDRTFIGTIAGESFFSGSGNDSVDGGGGVDTVIYSGLRADYAIASKLSGGFSVGDRTGRDGVDTLQNVERLLFADGGIALDVGAADSGGRTALLLGAVLPGSLALHPSKQALIGDVIELFDQGYAMWELSGAVLGLPIWNVLTGIASPSNRDVASYLLTNVLGRAPDQSSLSVAVDALNTGSFQARGEWLANLALSPESQNHIGLAGLAASGLAFL